LFFVFPKKHPSFALRFKAQAVTMNILLLGSGGREHAIAWKIAQSKQPHQLFIAPGNAGTSQYGTNLPIALNDFENIHKHCVQLEIDIVVVGPEDPLVNGIYDFLAADEQTRHIKVIGPSKDAARLEGSKAFAKAFMKRHQIPTAAYGEFYNDNFQDGLQYIRNHSTPVVLKADGLAGGKGVLICENTVEAIAEFELMISHSKFGEAGKRVVVEEFLKGIEFSVFAITDGSNYKLLPVAKDYKRVGEGDTGLNTGGMGAVSPVPFADAALMQKVEERIVKPTIAGLKAEGLVYIGFVYFGLINVEGEPFVIEYNCRLGDPETEVVLPRIKNDLIEVLNALASGKLAGLTIETDERAAVTVVATSGGYPGNYNTGYKIKGLSSEMPADSHIFIAGAKEEQGEVLTNGGRVLAVTSLAASISEASMQSRQVLRQVDFADMYYRHDIGYEFDS
jgi:phosphoribosylamine---glycine ligase